MQALPPQTFGIFVMRSVITVAIVLNCKDFTMRAGDDIFRCLALALHKSNPTAIIYRSNRSPRPSDRYQSVNQIQEHGERRSMRVNNNFGKVAILAAALLLMSFTLSFAKPHVEYKFKVHNNTKQAIKKIKVSDDGKKWGFFDIGDGIAAGATEELVWDKSTDNGACEWQFKAVFADGEESEAVEFNFCEKNLVIEFN
jgi:hypothetical protein